MSSQFIRGFVLLTLFSGCSTPQLRSGSTPELKASAPPEREIKVFPETPQFVVECRDDGRPFSLSFQSKSGELSKNDMTVSVLFENEEKAVPVSPGLYRAVDVMDAFPSLCEGLPAFRVEGTEKFIVFLSLMVSPGKNETSLLLMDLGSKKILNTLERIGVMSWTQGPRYHVIPAENGFQVKLDQGWKRITIKKTFMTAKWMNSGKKKVKY